MNYLFRTLKSQEHRLLITLLLVCHVFWSANVIAAQNALVFSDRAIIYADEKMTSPIGFVRKGKTVRIGDIPKNKAQVYSIIVSGKRAFIRAIDITLVSENRAQENEVQRFKETTVSDYHMNYSLSYVSYATQISLESDNGGLSDKDNFDFSGISIYGQALIVNRFDIDILINYLEGKNGDELFRTVEVGGGLSYRIVDFSRLKLRWYGHLLLIPFSNYAYGDKFRINSYGLSTGTGLKLDFYFSENWAVEFLGGIHYTKLFKFDAPQNFSDIEPSFMGTRLGLGLNYRF